MGFLSTNVTDGEWGKKNVCHLKILYDDVPFVMFFG